MRKARGLIKVALAKLAALHSRKTGALLLASLRLGQFAGQGGRPDPEQRRCLDEFGTAFGLAFQITDDLLDVEGSSAAVGKRTGKDAARNKLTYPSLLGSAESRRRAEELCRRAASAVAPLGRGGVLLAALARSLPTRTA